MPPLLGDKPKEGSKDAIAIDAAEAVRRNHGSIATTTTSNPIPNKTSSSSISSHGGMPRIMSAPALGTRKRHKPRRQPLVEQHYKIDKENRALLPGVPKYDEDLARDIHDFFNLICLVSCQFGFLSIKQTHPYHVLF